jgi:hypothetical protein
VVSALRIYALVRHEKAVEMFAQAGGMPGCLAWGNIRLVLAVCWSSYTTNTPHSSDI